MTTPRAERSTVVTRPAILIEDSSGDAGLPPLLLAVALLWRW